MLFVWLSKLSFCLSAQLLNFETIAIVQKPTNVLLVLVKHIAKFVLVNYLSSFVSVVRIRVFQLGNLGLDIVFVGPPTDQLLVFMPVW